MVRQLSERDHAEEDAFEIYFDPDTVSFPLIGSGMVGRIAVRQGHSRQFVLDRWFRERCVGRSYTGFIVPYFISFAPIVSVAEA